MKLSLPSFANISQRFKNYFLGGSGGGSFYTWVYGGLENKNQRELLNEYRNLVYTCVSVIAQEVAKYQPVLRNKDGKHTAIEAHPFLTLIEKPNAYMTQYEMFEAISTFMDLSGEIFLYFPFGEQSKKPKEIHLMRPDRVKVVVDDETGDILGYKYMKPDGTEIAFEPYEIWHHKNLNPEDPYRGLGTVQAGLLSIQTETSASKFQYNFLKNQATPSGIVSLKTKATKEAFDKLKKQWKEAHSGLDNVGRTVFTNGGDLEFIKIGMSLADLDMGGIKELTKQEVLNLFRVPKAILGETDSSGLGRANVETIEYIFAKRTIEPRLVRMDDMFRLLIKRFYGQDLIVEHISQVPEDRQAKINEWVQGVDKWLSRNEIRLLQGLEPIDGADFLYTAFNQTVIGEEQQVKQEEKGIKIKIKKVIKDVSDESAKDRRFFNSLDSIDKKTAGEYKKGLKGLLNTQQDKVGGVVAHAKSKQIVETIDGINFHLEFTTEELEKLLVLPLIRALQKSGDTSMEFWGPPDSEFLLEQATRDAVFESTERLMKSFNEQTALKIQKQLVAGLANNESSAQLTKRIESIYKEAKGSRAERIAVTEAHDAVNEGTKQTFKQLGFKKMKWVANPNACEFCEAMDGTTIEIGENFLPKGSTVTGTKGGEYIADYKDVSNAHLHPDCHCYLEPI